MKHFVLACLLFVLSVPLANAQSNGAVTLSIPSLRIPNDTTLPATCTVGEIYMDTDATSGARFYLCESANTWVAQGGAGGASSVTATSAFGTDNAVLRADGTSRGAQSSGCSIGDTNVLTCPGGFVAGTAGTGAVTMLQGTVPSAPSAGEHTLYFDSADSLLKSKASSSTVTTYTTTTGTQSLTNKTLDCEATGNVCTIPKRYWFPAAGVNNTTGGSIWDLPATNPAAVSFRTGTNQTKGVLDFADGADLSASLVQQLAATWAGTIEARVVWISATTANDVVWQIAIACAGDGDSDDPAFTWDEFAADTAKGTPNLLNYTASNTVTTTGTCTAGDLAYIGIRRNSAHALDTHTATARFIGLELVTRVTE